MDPVEILFTAAVAAAVGGGAAEWRTRAAETRAEKREAAAELRADDREAKRLRRDYVLRQIQDTGADIEATLTYRMLRAIGATAAMAEVRQGPVHYPDAHLYLIGDETLLRQIIEFEEEMDDRVPGSGFSAHDLARLGSMTGHIRAQIDGQRDRVSRGLPPAWPSAAFVKEMVDRAGERFGIPPEYRPPIDTNASDDPPPL